MTKYLVMPINTVKRSIEEVTSGNLAISIPEFGNNCAGRLIPGINSLSSNISALVNEIRTSSQTAMTLSEQLAEPQRRAFSENRTAIRSINADGCQHG